MKYRLGIILRASSFLCLALLALTAGCGGSKGGGIPATTQADLSSLDVSNGVLSPRFASGTTSYSALFIGTASVTVTPVAAAGDGASVQVNGQAVNSGSPSGSIALNNGQNTILVKVTAPDGSTTKTYTVTAIRISQEAYAKASNTETRDYFGWSVSLSGDTLAVGAYGEFSNATGVNGDQTDNSAPGSGAVYVFTRTNGVWSQQAYLKASNTRGGDNFGYSVSLSGDTLAVGAPYEDSNATGVNGDQTNDSASGSGAVYVFTRTNGVWSQQAYLKASNTGVLDLFGWSVSLSGDTLAVGAYYEDSNATGVTNGTGAAGTDDGSHDESGAVYVFTRTNGAWTQQAYIKASNTEAWDNFGWSVSLSGDTLAVGAPYESSNATGVNGDQTDNSASSSGAAYVFTRTNGAWSQQAYIKASNTGASDLFGYCVSLSGDTLAVGAIHEDSNALGVTAGTGSAGTDDGLHDDSGAVYVFY